MIRNGWVLERKWSKFGGEMITLEIWPLEHVFKQPGSLVLLIKIRWGGGGLNGSEKFEKLDSGNFYVSFWDVISLGGWIVFSSYKNIVDVI